ncbi:DUF4259 domain-containing protein [Brevibacillus migulae]|uniref:DUF4259 domain-containing protein n=1 Tax=Brevibacillus migulae TaxID=1644114 RepID=UPI0014309D32|nr:DUF4259 domain-containing protein [Brevibacillus migulae]
MGAWGIGFFENDQAIDWKYELLEGSDLSFVRETLEQAKVEEFLDADLSVQALAASEIIAALLGKPGHEVKNNEGEIEDLVEWIARYQGKGKEKELTPLALEVVNRIRLDSELRDLWMDAEEFRKWDELLLDLERRLR